MRELSRRGGDYHRATTAVAVKSTVSHPPAVPPPIHSFQTGTAFLLDDTGQAQQGHSGTKYWHPVPLKLAHSQQTQLETLVEKAAGYHKPVWHCSRCFVTLADNSNKRTMDNVIWSLMV